jgi:broad specificity phosphatase PhoE
MPPVDPVAPVAPVAPGAGRLFLVRHGQTTWNVAGRAQGQAEVPLDETGRAQALRVAEHLASALGPYRPSALWSSDLGRCSETMAPIARATELVASFHRELRERTFGEWEGEPLADIRLRLEALALASGAPLMTLRPPGGESHADVWQRVAPTIERVRATFASGVRSIVLVSHGGFASTMLARMLSGSIDTARSFRLRNASVTEIEARPDGMFQLIRFDDVSHLG